MTAAQARSIAIAGIAAFAAVAPSLARAAEEGESALPQLKFSTYPPQLFWLAVLLVAFFFILRNSALPKIEGALEARRRKVDDDLDKAAAHREEAELAMAAYEKALAEAGEQARDIHRQIAQEIAENAARRRADLADKLAEDAKAAEARIAAAKEPALAGLKDVAAEVVQEAAAKLAGLKVTDAEAKSAVADSMKGRT